MKREDKNQQSKNKILNAAIAEFGTKSYGISSLNNICGDNDISKGLIYHYYTNKDELYLHCVKVCFDELTKYVCDIEYAFKEFKDDINHYLNRRYEFFHDNPYYSNIFFNTVLQPPKHLKKQINDLRSDFDEKTTLYYKSALKNVTLRDGINDEDAIEYLFMFQEMFNSYFQSIVDETSDFHSLIEAHESKLSKMLGIMLYGIIKT